MFVAIIGLVMITSVHLHRLNKGHAKMRVAMGKSAIIVDTSLDTAEEVARRKANGATQGNGESDVATRLIEEVDSDDSRQGSRERVGEHAFDDLTDLKNEEFIFVL